MPKKEKNEFTYYKPRATRETIIRRRGSTQNKIAREPLVIGAKYEYDGQTLKMVEEPDVPVKSIQIRPGVYRTREGSKAKVFYVNANVKDETKFMVVGAVESKPGYWIPMAWNYEGWTRAPYGKINDLIEEWSEG